ncbi:MAG TPA: ABC transporter ATP-binding protein [Sphingomicrobium sp.]|nr:ABC transporter ATP-binding protein [Sphingomicrobium sp.]
MLILYRSISLTRRTQLLRLAVLVPLSAAAEMLMIASIVPFLAMLGGGEPIDGLMLRPLATVERSLQLSPVAFAAGLFAASAILASALRLWLARSSFIFAADLGHEINMGVQRRMLHQPYLFHAASHSSRLLASLEKVDLLVLGFALTGLQALGSAVIGLAIVAVLLLVDPPSAVIAIVLVAGLYCGALLSIRRSLRETTERYATTHERRIHIVQESLAGIRDIIIDRSQDARLHAFGSTDREYVQARARISFLSVAPRHIVEGIGLGLIAVAALLLADRPGGLAAAIPVLGALALGAQRLLPLASQLYSAWAGLIAARPVVREITALLQLPLPRETSQIAPPVFDREISFDRVGFHYPDRSGPALHDISLTILRGSQVAIVGRSGSGKSTLADLLMGLLEPTSGQIRVDGTLLTGGALTAWLQSVAHVPQSIFVADTTIAGNIAFVPAGAPVDMAEVRRAATIAQLDEFVLSLPLGYDTRTGERGARLSGGQRQRLALARAIYKRAPLLVLDEATSSLDEPTEGAVLGALDELKSDGCTIVIVAHRLSTVQGCDKIFMLDEGSVVQAGSFTQLFGRLNQLQEMGEL